MSFNLNNLLNQLNSSQELQELCQNIECRIGKFGGRHYIYKNGETESEDYISYNKIHAKCLELIREQRQGEIDIEEISALKRSVVRLDVLGNTKLSHSSLFQKFFTFFKHLTNIFRDRNRELERVVERFEQEEQVFIENLASRALHQRSNFSEEFKEEIANITSERVYQKFLDARPDVFNLPRPEFITINRSLELLTRTTRKGSFAATFSLHDAVTLLECWKEQRPEIENAINEKIANLTSPTEEEVQDRGKVLTTARFVNEWIKDELGEELYQEAKLALQLRLLERFEDANPDWKQSPDKMHWLKDVLFHMYTRSAILPDESSVKAGLREAVQQQWNQLLEAEKNLIGMAAVKTNVSSFQVSLEEALSLEPPLSPYPEEIAVDTNAYPLKRLDLIDFSNPDEALQKTEEWMGYIQELRDLEEFNAVDRATMLYLEQLKSKENQDLLKNVSIENIPEWCQKLSQLSESVVAANFALGRPCIPHTRLAGLLRVFYLTQSLLIKDPIAAFEKTSFEMDLIEEGFKDPYLDLGLEGKACIDLILEMQERENSLDDQDKFLVQADGHVERFYKGDRGGRVPKNESLAFDPVMHCYRLLIISVMGGHLLSDQVNRSGRDFTVEDLIEDRKGVHEKLSSFVGEITFEREESALIIHPYGVKFYKDRNYRTLFTNSVNGTPSTFLEQHSQVGSWNVRSYIAEAIVAESSAKNEYGFRDNYTVTVSEKLHVYDQDGGKKYSVDALKSVKVDGSSLDALNDGLQEEELSAKRNLSLENAGKYYHWLLRTTQRQNVSLEEKFLFAQRALQFFQYVDLSEEGNPFAQICDYYDQELSIILEKAKQDEMLIQQLLTLRMPNPDFEDYKLDGTFWSDGYVGIDLQRGKEFYEEDNFERVEIGHPDLTVSKAFNYYGEITSQAQIQDEALEDPLFGDYSDALCKELRMMQMAPEMRVRKTLELFSSKPFLLQNRDLQRIFNLNLFRSGYLAQKLARDPQSIDHVLKCLSTLCECAKNGEIPLPFMATAAARIVATVQSLGLEIEEDSFDLLDILSAELEEEELRIKESKTFFLPSENAQKYRQWLLGTAQRSNLDPKEKLLFAERALLFFRYARPNEHENSFAEICDCYDRMLPEILDDSVSFTHLFAHLVALRVPDADPEAWEPVEGSDALLWRNGMKTINLQRGEVFIEGSPMIPIPAAAKLKLGELVSQEDKRSEYVFTNHAVDGKEIKQIELTGTILGQEKNVKLFLEDAKHCDVFVEMHPGEWFQLQEAPFTEKGEEYLPRILHQDRCWVHSDSNTVYFTDKEGALKASGTCSSNTIESLQMHKEGDNAPVLFSRNLPESEIFERMDTKNGMVFSGDAKQVQGVSYSTLGLRYEKDAETGRWVSPQYPHHFLSKGAVSSVFQPIGLGDTTTQLFTRGFQDYHLLKSADPSELPVVVIAGRQYVRKSADLQKHTTVHAPLLPEECDPPLLFTYSVDPERGLCATRPEGYLYLSYLLYTQGKYAESSLAMRQGFQRMQGVSPAAKMILGYFKEWKDLEPAAELPDEELLPEEIIERKVKAERLTRENPAIVSKYEMKCSRELTRLKQRRAVLKEWGSAGPNAHALLLKLALYEIEQKQMEVKSQEEAVLDEEGVYKALVLYQEYCREEAFVEGGLRLTEAMHEKFRFLARRSPEWVKERIAQVWTLKVDARKKRLEDEAIEGGREVKRSNAFSKEIAMGDFRRDWLNYLLVEPEVVEVMMNGEANHEEIKQVLKETAERLHKQEQKRPNYPKDDRDERIGPYIDNIDDAFEILLETLGAAHIDIRDLGFFGTIRHLGDEKQQLELLRWGLDREIEIRTAELPKVEDIPEPVEGLALEEGVSLFTIPENFLLQEQISPAEKEKMQQAIQELREVFDDPDSFEAEIANQLADDVEAYCRIIGSPLEGGLEEEIIVYSGINPAADLNALKIDMVAKKEELNSEIQEIQQQIVNIYREETPTFFEQLKEQDGGVSNLFREGRWCFGSSDWTTLTDKGIDPSRIEELSNLYCDYLLRSTERQQATRAIELLSDLEEGGEERDVKEQELLSILQTKRHYDTAHEMAPAILLLEDELGVICQKNQVDHFADMISYQSSFKHEAWAGGKTYILRHLITKLHANGTYASSLVTHAPLIEEHHEQLKESTTAFYGQQAYRFDFNRASPDDGIAIRREHLKLVKAIQEKGRVDQKLQAIISSVHAHNLRVLDFQEDGDEDALDAINAAGRFLAFRQERMVIGSDELGQLFTPDIENNFATGAPFKVPETITAPAIELMRVIDGSPEFKPFFAEKGKSPTQMNEAEQQALREVLVTHFYDTYTFDKEAISLGDLMLYCSPIPEKSLGESEEEYEARLTQNHREQLRIHDLIGEQEDAQKLYSISIFLGQVFPTVHKTKLGVNFGRSKKDGIHTKPYAGSAKCNESSQHSSLHLMAIYSAMDIYKEGIKEESKNQAIGTFVTRFKEKAAAEEGEDTATQFFQTFGVELHEVAEGNYGNIAKKINGDLELKFLFLNEVNFKNATYNSKRQRGNSKHVGHECQAIWGNDGNSERVRTLPKIVQRHDKLIRQEGTIGRIFYNMIKGYEPGDIKHLGNKTEIARFLARNLGPQSAFIDLGPFFEGIPPEECVSEMVDSGSRHPIRYVNSKGEVVVRLVNGEEIAGNGKVPKGNCQTLFSQTEIRGRNLLLPDDSEHWISISSDSDLTNFSQAGMRARKWGKGQKLRYLLDFEGGSSPAELFKVLIQNEARQLKKLHDISTTQEILAVGHAAVQKILRQPHSQEGLLVLREHCTPYLEEETQVNLEMLSRPKLPEPTLNYYENLIEKEADRLEQLRFSIEKNRDVIGPEICATALKVIDDALIELQETMPGVQEAKYYPDRKPTSGEHEGVEVVEMEVQLEVAEEIVVEHEQEMEIEQEESRGRGRGTIRSSPTPLKGPAELISQAALPEGTPCHKGKLFTYTLFGETTLIAEPTTIKGKRALGQESGYSFWFGNGPLKHQQLLMPSVLLVCDKESGEVISVMGSAKQQDIEFERYRERYPDDEQYSSFHYTFEDPRSFKEVFSSLSDEQQLAVRRKIVVEKVRYALDVKFDEEERAVLAELIAEYPDECEELLPRLREYLDLFSKEEEPEILQFFIG